MAQKPPKPYPQCPLFAHANGQWAKKIDGRFVYYGPWSDFEGALQRYHHEKDGPSHTVKTCVDRFLASRRLLQKSGEISYRHLKDIEHVLASLSVATGVEAANEEPFCADPTNLAGAAAKQIVEPLGLSVPVDGRRSRPWFRF